jgi:hypothetical protein
MNKQYNILKKTLEQNRKIAEFLNDKEKVKKQYESFMEHVKDYKVINLNQNKYE